MYVDEERKVIQPFFVLRATEVESANALSIYGLTPSGTSRFKNMQVCHKMCYIRDGLENILVKWNGSLQLVVSAVSLVASWIILSQ